MIECKKILLAEDDLDDYIFMADAINKVAGKSELVRAVNGVDCLSWLRNTDVLPELIFLDLNMSLKNGLECLLVIKNTEALKNIPVIIYSHSHYIKDIDAAYKNGAHYYIVKPTDAGMLVDVLQVVFDRFSLTLATPPKESFVIRMGAELEN